MAKRFIVSLTIAAGLLCAGLGSARAQIADAKCADKANNFARKVSAAQNNAVRGCIKAKGNGTLQGTVEACLAADPDQKVQSKEDKVVALFADASTINTAHVNESIALAHDIFGANLDSGQLSQMTAESKCQDGIAHRAGQLFDAWAKQFRACKKAAMKSGAANEAAVITACLSGVGARGIGSALGDPAGKVKSKGDKLGA